MIRGKNTTFKHIVKAADFNIESKSTKSTKNKKGFNHSDKDVAAYKKLVRIDTMSGKGGSATTDFLVE